MPQRWSISLSIHSCPILSFFIVKKLVYCEYKEWAIIPRPDQSFWQAIKEIQLVWSHFMASLVCGSVYLSIYNGFSGLHTNQTNS